MADNENDQEPISTTRRDFLKGIAVGATAAAAASILVEEWRFSLPHREEMPEEITKREVKLTVNGEVHNLEVESHWTLLHVLRKRLGLTGAKDACEQGGCGACTVLLDGRPIYSCIMLAIDCDGHDIATIEGLSNSNTGELHPIQKAFIEQDGLECGYCTPGFIMSTEALLRDNPNPSKEEIKSALAGNLCKCGAYIKIIKSVEAAAKKLQGVS